MTNVGKSTPGVPNQGWGLYIVSVVMVIVSGLFVVARIGIRVARRMMGMDDYMIILALVSLIFLTLTECLAVVNGYGKHREDITHEQMVLAFRWFYGAQIVYKIAVAFYKLSMLFLFLRIFPSKRFRVATYTLISLVTVSAFAFVLVTIWQCKPIAAFWDKTLLKEPGNHCFSSKAFWFSYSVINIVLDFAILLLPIHEVLQLQLPITEKLALVGVFSLGIFVCATTIIRTTTLAASADSKDPTWGIIPATIWSVVEANTGTICACLPTLKKPLSLLFPRLFATSTKSSPGFFDHTPQGEGVYRLEDGKGEINGVRGRFGFPPSASKTSATDKPDPWLKSLDANTWQLKSVESSGTGDSGKDNNRPSSGESEERLTTPEAAAQMGVGQAITANNVTHHHQPGILRTTDVDVRYGHEGGKSGDFEHGTTASARHQGEERSWAENTWPSKNSGSLRTSQQGFHLPRRSETVALAR